MTTALAPKRRRMAERTQGQPGSKGQKKKAEDKTEKPKLRVLDRASMRRSARRRLFVSTSIVLIAATLFGVALLYARLVEGQQYVDQVRVDIAQAEADRARLERNIAIASTPDAIVQRAVEFGMVRAVNPEYLVAVRSTADSGAGS